MLAPGEPVLVGFSGGGDSTALLAMLAPIARAQGRRLIAAIVDHALREGSAADAARAASIGAGLGAEVALTRIAWPQTPRSSQAAARTARYAALARTARDVGARTLFLGHTLDDQAETLVIRRQAGSGPRGLAGMAPMAPCPIWPEGRDLSLARPLLSWRRATLRTMLREAGIDWLEDPANALTRYARVGVRAALAPADAPAIGAEAAVSARLAASEDRAAADWIARHGAFHEDMVLVEGASLDDPAAPRALAALAAACGGALREPSPEAVGQLVSRLASGQDSTLAGARFRPGERLRVTRDPGGVTGRRGGTAPTAPLVLPAGAPAVWDRRLELTAAEGGWVAAPPPAKNGRLAPVLRWEGERTAWRRARGLSERWLIRERVERLLWRANCSLFTGP